MKYYILKNYKNAFLILFTVLIAVLIGTHRSDKKLIQNLKADKILLNDSIDSFKNKAGKTVVETQIAVYTDDSKIKSLSNEVFNLKRSNQRLIKQVNSFGQITQSIIIDTLLIPYTDTFYVNITKPIKYSLVNKDFSISGEVLSDGVKVNRLEIPNTVSFRDIEKSKGFFKGTETTYQVINSNPYITTTGVTFIKVKNQKSEWDKWIKPVVVGIGASVLTYYITK